MGSETFGPAVAVALLVAMVMTCLARRIPLWNPTYFFASAFIAEIVLGWFLARVLGMQFPGAFAGPLLTAYVAMASVLFIGTMASNRSIRAAAMRRTLLEGMVLTPGAARKLLAILVAALCALALSNVIVTIQWGTLPVIAYNTYGQEAIRFQKNAVPGDVAAAFMVPGLTAHAVHLVNPAVVAYFLLVFLPKVKPRRGRDGTGWSSVSRWIHVLMVGLLLNALVIPQRHIVMVALFTLVMLFVLTGRLRPSRVLAIAVAGLALQLGLGAARRGGERYLAAEAIGLPAVAGATILYEPAIYLASGIPNLYTFWRRNDPHGFGELLFGPVLPESVNRMMGFQNDRAELLRRLSSEGWVLPGETLRTPWFELYYEFGWPGVIILATLMGALVFGLYRRTLRPHGRASVTYFVAAKPLFMFAIINNVFDRPVILQFVLGAVLTYIIRTSSARAGRTAALDLSGATIAAAPAVP